MNWKKELEKIWTKNPSKFRDTIKFIEENFELKSNECKHEYLQGDLCQDCFERVPNKLKINNEEGCCKKCIRIDPFHPFNVPWCGNEYCECHQEYESDDDEARMLGIKGST